MRKSVFLLAAALALPRAAPAAPPASGWHIPVEVRTLPNGLTVVVSEEHSAPTSAFPPPIGSASGWSLAGGRASLTCSST